VLDGLPRAALAVLSGVAVTADDRLVLLTTDWGACGRGRGGGGGGGRGARKEEEEEEEKEVGVVKDGVVLLGGACACRECAAAGLPQRPALRWVAAGEQGGGARKQGADCAGGNEASASRRLAEVAGSAVVVAVADVQLRHPLSPLQGFAALVAAHCAQAG
jgi:hypothetical protein